MRVFLSSFSTRCSRCLLVILLSVFVHWAFLLIFGVLVRIVKPFYLPLLLFQRSRTWTCQISALTSTHEISPAFLLLEGQPPTATLFAFLVQAESWLILISFSFLPPSPPCLFWSPSSPIYYCAAFRSVQPRLVRTSFFFFWNLCYFLHQALALFPAPSIFSPLTLVSGSVAIHRERSRGSPPYFFSRAALHLRTPDAKYCVAFRYSSSLHGIRTLFFFWDSRFGSLNFSYSLILSPFRRDEDNVRQSDRSLWFALACWTWGSTHSFFPMAILGLVTFFPLDRRRFLLFHGTYPFRSLTFSVFVLPSHLLVLPF